MISGKRRVKHLVWLAVAQAVSVALAIWLHHRLIVSAIQQQAEREIGAALGEAVARLDAQRLLGDERAIRTSGLAALARAIPTRPGRPLIQLVLIDAENRVLDLAPALDEGAWQLAAGDAIVWTAPPQPSPAAKDQLRGLLTLADGPHLALVVPLAGSGERLVLHGSIRSADVSLARLSGSLGAAGAIALFWALALLTISTYLIAARLFDELREKGSQTDGEALRRIQSLSRTRDAVIFGMAKLAESRDGATGMHLDRICAYASRLAAALSADPRYRDVVTAEFVHNIAISAALHDIGKVGIEDAILHKPSYLTEDEKLRMQQHTHIGGNCLLEMERRLGTSNFLQMAREIAVSHHERWDGAGYPAGLAGEEIPLAARIVAIADVYDAFSTERCYKDAFPHEQCVARIRREAGKHFDPYLVDVFLRIEGVFREIARRYGNQPAASNEGATALCKAP